MARPTPVVSGPLTMLGARARRRGEPSARLRNKGLWSLAAPGVHEHRDLVNITTATMPTVLHAGAIKSLPAEPLGNLVGVSHRVLWHDATSMAGVLTVDAGHRLGRHSHRVNHHHLWMLEGHATILGTVLGPGGYAHIPSGVDHDIDATATDGCTVFYLYVHQAP